LTHGSLGAVGFFVGKRLLFKRYVFVFLVFTSLRPLEADTSLPIGREEAKFKRFFFLIAVFPSPLREKG
jgi:hypothetical protein